MIESCRACRRSWVVPGQRNAKRLSWCRSCSLQALAAEDLLTRAEAAELAGAASPT